MVRTVRPGARRRSGAHPLRGPGLIGRALLGLAAGDVLGAGIEGEDRRAVRALHGPVVRSPAVGARYTDDTQEALVVAYHLLRHDGIDPEALAREFATLAGPPSVYRGIGPGFASFLAHLADGAGPEEAAQPSAGNGAAMRVAPVTIRYHGDFDEVIRQSVRMGLVTHADPVGVAAAAAVAVAVWASHLGQRGPDLVQSAADAAAVAEHQLFSEWYERLRPGDHWHEMSEALRAAVGLAGAPADDVAAAVGEVAATTSRFGRSDGTDAYAPASVITALTVAAGAGDPVEAVGTVAGLGGDTDTMAAIAGAVWGATGFADWPWHVPNRELLIEVGQRLAAGDSGVDALPDLYELEGR